MFNKCENRNLRNYYLDFPPNSYFPPFGYTLHWFPSSPRKYTCSLAETIILHMCYSIIKASFLNRKEVLILNPSPTRFATHFLRIMPTLRLKNSLRGTVHLQEFIALKLRKEEGNVAIIKEHKSFHQRQILIKMAKPLLILLRMVNSNQPQIDKIRLMVIMVDYHIRMSMLDLKDEDYFNPVT